MFKKEIKKLLAVPMVCIMMFAITVPSFATEKNDASDTAIDGGENADIDGIEILNKSTYEDDSKIVVSTEIAIDYSDFGSVEEFNAALRESLGNYDTNETAAYSDEMTAPEDPVDSSALNTPNEAAVIKDNITNNTESVLPGYSKGISEAIRGTMTQNDKSAIKNINKILDLVLFSCCKETQPNITSE